MLKHGSGTADTVYSIMKNDLDGIDIVHKYLIYNKTVILSEAEGTCHADRTCRIFLPFSQRSGPSLP
jgi:hypothetical protein